MRLTKEEMRLRRTRRPEMLDQAERDLIVEALDSHLYWQVSDEQYRRDGEVFDPERPDEDVISDDPEKQAEGVRIRKLIEKLGG